MGLFDGLADALFKKDASGNPLFYPWGVLGSGFVIKSKEKYNQIRNYIKNLYIFIFIVMMPAIVVITLLANYWVLVPLLIFYIFFFCCYFFFFCYYFFTIKRITKDLPKTTERLKISQALKNAAKSISWPMLFLLELFSIGFVGSGVWLLFKGQNQIIVLASISLFGLCSIAYGYMIFTKLKK